jgi:hypothetical protein
MEKYGYNNIEELKGLVLQNLPAPPLFTVPNAKWS